MYLIYKMDMLKLSAIAVTAAILAVFLKQYKNEYALFVSLIGGAVLLALSLPHVREITAALSAFAAKIGLSGSYLGAVFKVICVSVITEYSAAICRDAGEGALSVKLEMAGKLCILALTMPVVTALFETVIGILP